MTEPARRIAGGCLCGGLVFGGEAGRDTSAHDLCRLLDDPSIFGPTIAIFTRDRSDWIPLLPGLTLFETMPE